MPRRNLKKLRADTKEKRQRTTKLMEISLRVEDHVYKNKIISAMQARGYLHDVQELKDKCQDVPSRQVVEKLTKVMKQIIIDEENDLHMETTADTNDINSNQLTPDIFSESPARFLSDRHEIEEVRAANISKDKESYEVGQTVDLCNDSSTDEMIATVEDITKRPSNHESVAEVSRAISHLSVHEDCTASINTILHSHAAIEYFDSCAQGFEEYEKDLSVIQVQIGKSNTKGKKNGIQPTVEPKTPTVDFKGNKIKKIPDGKPKANKVNKTNVKRKFKPPAKIPSVKDSKKAIIPKNTCPMAAINENVMTKTSDTAKNKRNSLKIPQDRKTILDNSAQTPATYTETDISWVENIKYVRQVANDEYIPAGQISESFWTNCDFPADWDETDFVCS